MLYYQFGRGMNMDATKTIFKQTAFFFLTTLLLATTGRAQTLSANPSSAAFTSAALPVAVQITSVSGAAVSFTVAKGSGQTHFYSFDISSGTTPATITVTLISTAGCTTGCSGNITVTPASGTALNIPVTFTPGGGGGNLIVLSATSVPLSVATQGQSTTSSVNVSTSNGSAPTCSAISDRSWLTFAGGFTTANLTLSGTPQALGFTANSSFLTINPDTATVTIACPSISASNSFTVTLTVGAGGGTGALSVSPTSLTFAYPGGVTAQAVSVFSNNGTVTTYNSYANTNSGGAWLLANGQSGLTGPYNVSGGLNVSIDTSVASTLALSGAATYTGQVTIYNGANSAIVNVTLNVGGGGSGGGPYTLTPSSVVLGYPNATSSTACSSVTPYSSCTVTITPKTSGVTTYYAYVNNISPTNWLLLNNSASTVAANVSDGLNLSLNTSALGSLQSGNTYTAQVYLCYIDCTANASTPLTVNLQVGAGGGTISSLAAPSALSFAYQLTKSVPLAQTVLVNYSAAYTVTPSVNTVQQWLKAGGLSTAQTLNFPYFQVSVDPTGLTAGSYQGTIGISAGASSQNITVTLLVTSSPVVQTTNQGSIFLFGNTSQTYTISLGASDNSSVNVSLSSSQSWITVSPTSVTTPANFAVVVNPTSLCNGLNAGAITMTSSGTANPNAVFPVVALVSGSTNTNCGSGTGNLTFNPSTTLTFATPNNTTLPSGQTLTVSSNSSVITQGTVATVTSSGGNWLLINNGVYNNATLITFPASLTISANPSGLANGIYSGYLQFVAGGATQNVSVTLNVGGGSGNISVSPTSITVTAPVGTTPSGQTLAVSNASGTSAVQFTVNISTTSGGSWLSATANGVAIGNGTSLNTPQTITVNINPAGLTTGQQYSGSVVLSPTGGTAVTVPVNFTVQATSVVSATPTSLTFQYTIGDAAPATKAITVSGSGQNPLSFSATAQTQSGGNWLSVTPTTGSTPATLNAGLNTAAITAAGTFTGTIVVAGTGSATGSTTITVTLTAIAPLPTITQVGNAASYAGGAIAPGEIITVFGTGLGPTPAVQSPKIDTATGLVSTTLGGVQVLINGFACPMIYASNKQISAIVPYELKRSVNATILVQYLGQSSNGISASVSPTAPGIFTANASGTGPGAILNANLTQNSPSNPANKGDVVAIYMTGEGETAPSGVTGKVTTVSATPPLTPQPLLPVGVVIDGQPVAVTFYGEAPGLVSGVLQVNAVIPTNARSGNLSLVVNIGSGTSQAAVTVSVK